MLRLISKKTYLLFSIIWLVIITVLSLTPGNYIPPVPFELISPDVIAHFTFYAILIFLILAYFSKNKLTIYSSVFLFCLTYGYLIELIQGNFIPGRFFDISDVYMNSIGTIGGAFAYFLLFKKQ